jgi:hypothetical protein
VCQDAIGELQQVLDESRMKHAEAEEAARDARAMQQRYEAALAKLERVWNVPTAVVSQIVDTLLQVAEMVGSTREGLQASDSLS